MNTNENKERTQRITSGIIESLEELSKELTSYAISNEETAIKKIQEKANKAIYKSIDSLKTTKEKSKPKNSVSSIIFFVLAIIVIYNFITSTIIPVQPVVASQNETVKVHVTAKSGLAVRKVPEENVDPFGSVGTETDIIIDVSENENGFVKTVIAEGEGYVHSNYFSNLRPVRENDAIAYTKNVTSIRKSNSDEFIEIPSGARIIIMDKQSGSTLKMVYISDDGELITGHINKEDVYYFKLPSSNQNVLINDVSYCQNDNDDKSKNISTVEKMEKFLIEASQNENFGGLIIKVAYRGYVVNGKIKEDSMYKIYVEACENVGCPYGVYFWTEAINDSQVEEEIQKFSSYVKSIQKNSYWFKLPIGIDSEDTEMSNGEPTPNSKNWDKKGPCTIKVIKGMEEATGRQIMLYTCRNLYNQNFLNFDGNVWIAEYLKNIDTNDSYTDQKTWNMKGNLVMWQFSKKYGEKDLDANLVKKDVYQKWIES